MLMISKNRMAVKVLHMTGTSTPAEVKLESLQAAEKDTVQYALSPQQFVYVCLTAVFVTCLLIADVIGVKLFEIPLPFEIFGRRTIEVYT